MRRNSIFFLFIISVICVSCQDRRLANQLNALLGQTIRLPDNMQATLRGKDYDASEFLTSPLKLVVWHDSLGCSSCEIKEIYKWEEMTDHAKALGDAFNIVLLFSPQSGDFRSLTVSLRSSGLDYPVFIDKYGDFFKQNPRIPNDKNLHTFLLDRDNKVVLVGNPVENEQLWALYKDKIRELVNAGE